MIVTDERGEIVFRNTRAVALMGGRHGDALAAQAVDELLDETAPGRVQRVLELYGPPRRTPLSCAPRASTTGNEPSVSSRSSTRRVRAPAARGRAA